MTEQLATPGINAQQGETYAFPVSFAQQRLWFLDRLEPGSAAYAIPLVVRLRGTLDTVALGDALTDLVARHEVLRTTFAEWDGEPRQVVSPSASFDLVSEDLRTSEDSERAALARVKEEANRPFDLESGPVIRGRLLRTGDDEHILAIVVHHIATDGWSAGVLLRDLGELYAARVEARPPELPELPVQYADFSLWQREWLQGERLEQQLSFWKGHLAGAPTVLELPSDRPRPAVQSLDGGHVRAVLPLELRRAIQALSAEEGTTMFMTLLSAFAALLSRYSGQDDVLVGTPIANRTRVEIEPLVGFFANTLVLRADLADDPTVRELLARTRDVTLDAFAHQDLPFEKLVEELNPERALSHSPLFQVLFAYQNVERHSLELPGLALSGVEVERHSAKWDLALFAGEQTDGLRISLEFARDLFDADRMERLLGHFRSMLEAFVASPTSRISQLPLLTEPERTALDTWNRTEREHEWSGRRVQELVEIQARATPDAVAVSFGDETMTYAVLDRLTNRLARRLRSLGVGEDVPVGVFMHRSIESVLAVLAVLKAGGAYAPLDPAYPTERLRFMLEDAGVPVLLTQQELAGVLPASGVHEILLDAEDAWEKRSDDSDEPLDVAGTDASLAYILFTSGSTGRPKGVTMPHGPLVNLLAWQREAWTGPARTLQYASLSFDVAFQEIFSTWSSGGTLVLVDEETRRDPEALIRLLCDENVERLFVPFVGLDQLASAAHRVEELPRLREVMTAGEALVSTPAIREFFDRLEGCVLHNQYGPTESHVVTAHTLRGAPGAWPERPPIGRPIANARIHLLDEALQPVPVGVPGELFIAGSVLARGYLNRPELTAERFLPDSLSSELHARMYSTGDLARYRSDGEIEYLGRADTQVKVRGYRVELGEIESVLLRHPRLREAVTVVREDRPGNQTLVAYVVPEEGPWPDVAALRELLRSTLPEYMVPTSFVFLASLPVSPNGKVDRRSLPAPENEVREEDYVAPTTDLERALAEMWQGVLGLTSPVGVDDDFFDLGGHSLLAVRLFAEIERLLRVRLPLSVIFEGATVSKLAAAVEAEQARSEPWTSLVPLRPLGSRPRLFLVHGRGGKLLLYRHLLRHLHAEQPVYGLQPIGLDGRHAMHTRFEEMAAHYVREIRRMQPEGPYLLGGLCYSGVLAYEMGRQLVEQGQEIALLALFDAFPYGDRPGRIELERRKIADFLARDLRGKTQWVGRRTRGARYKVSTRSRLALYRALVRMRVRPPRTLIDPTTIGSSAMRMYETPPAPVHVTLFRPSTPGADVAPAPSRWVRLALGGVDVRPVVADGIKHQNMMLDPYAGILAGALEEAIGEIAQRGEEEAA